MTINTFNERIQKMKSLLLKNSSTFTESKIFYRVSKKNITNLNLFTSVSNDPYYCLFFVGESSESSNISINLYKIKVNKGVAYFIPGEHAFSEEYETVLINSDNNLNLTINKINAKQFWSSYKFDSEYNNINIESFNITYFELDIGSAVSGKATV